MRKLYFRKPLATIASLLFVCISSMLINNACRKIDRLPSIDKNALEQKFFNSRASSVPVVKSVNGFVYRQNQRYDFLQGLVSKIGFPYWNKALIYSQYSIAAGRNASASDSVDIVYIPFVRESENFVNASLIVKMTKTDTAFKILYDYKYDEYGFKDSSANRWNAQDIFHIFAKLDNSVFNRKKFQIMDKRLLSEKGKTKMDSMGLSFDSIKVIYTIGNTAYGEKPSLAIPIVDCEIFDVCYDPSGISFECPNGGCTTGCVYYLHSEFICTTTWDNTMVTFNSEGGWNGGEPHPGGSGGWNPAPNPQPPTNYLNLGYKHFENSQVSPEDDAKIEYGRLNNIDTTGLDSCRKIMISQIILSTSSNLVGRILTKMDRSIFDMNNIEKFQVKYEILDTTWGMAGITHRDSLKYDATSGIFYSTIFINQKNLDSSTNIFIANTIIHETFHAYLASIVYRIRQGGVTISQLQKMSYDSLFNEFVDTMIVRNNLVQSDSLYISSSYYYHHNLMADKLVEKIADAVKNYANDPTISDEYFWYLAWKGLYESKTWLQYYPNFLTDWNAAQGNPASINPSSPAPNNNTTNGLKYAMTRAKLVDILQCHIDEGGSYQGSKGKVPIPGGCY